ncbi:MAG: OmpA family protein, partial [Kiloniellaceae bacterium]
TDSIGAQDFNDWLALRRAQSVKTHLVTLGLDPGRIHISGRGKCCYLKSNDTPSDRAANRRAEIRLTSFAKDAPSEGNPTANQLEK